MALLCGCTAEEEVSDPYERETYALVDGTPLTAAFVRDSVLISLKIREVNGRPLAAEKYDGIANAMASKIITQLISAIMMEKYLDLHHIQATPGTDAALLEHYNRVTKQKCATADELASAVFPDTRDVFLRQFKRESRLRVLSSENKIDEPITRKEKDAYYVSLTNRMRRAAKINELAHKHADEACSRLQKGEPWDVVAKEMSEDRLIDEERANYWKAWEEVPPDCYIYPEVLKALDGVSTNCYTKPFESEMGLLIVKVNAIEDGIRSCSRMMFRMAEEVPAVPENKLDGYLRRQKVIRLHRRCLDEIGEKIKIEYPKGEHFSVQIWPLQNNAKNQEGE